MDHGTCFGIHPSQTRGSAPSLPFAVLIPSYQEQQVAWITARVLGSTRKLVLCASIPTTTMLCTCALSLSRRRLAEWAVYYHLHLAESLVASGQAEEAAQQVTAAASLAGSQSLLQQQVSSGQPLHAAPQHHMTCWRTLYDASNQEPEPEVL